MVTSYTLLQNTTTSSPPFTSLNPFSPIPSLDFLFLSLSLFCFLLGTFGNITALKYFASKRLDIPHLLYIWINSTDILTSLLMLPMSVSYARGRAPSLLAHVGVCQLWGVLWNVTGRLSVFLVAMLSVTRCYQLCKPFFAMRRATVLGIVTGYAVLQLLIALLPYLYSSQYVYDRVSVTCLWTIVEDIHPVENRGGFLALYVCCVIVPTVLPVFPTLTSCLLSVRAIRSSARYRSVLGGSPNEGVRRVLRRRRTRGNHVAGERNDMATNTIILITVVYLICNAPLVIFLFCEIVSITTPLQVFHFTTHLIYIRLFLAIFSVSLNASLNPVIYYFRIRAFKRYSCRLQRGIRRSVRDNSQVLGSSVKGVVTGALKRVSSRKTMEVKLERSGVLYEVVDVEGVDLEKTENQCDSQQT